MKRRHRDAPSRKKSKQSSSSQPNYYYSSLLTPHTQRLLQLIRQGTYEHAQQAAIQLTKITSTASPIILWEVMGTLQAFLVSREWKTRQNAAMALQGVAVHLPLSDQTNFLQQSDNNQDTKLYLTVKDLNIQHILTQGRVLLAESDSKFDLVEEQQLQQFDHTSSRKRNFVQERVTLQRRILAQRLGLASLQTIAGDTVLPMEITSELEAMPSDTVNDSQNGCDIRTLLVSQMQQDMELSSAASHRNAQSLLATELVYRMLDPCWSTRHGAILGILSLLRAWHHSSCNFGSWPHDVLTRCLCVIALDRFGDFSGNAITAPVREMAGQLLAVLLPMAPPEIQYQIMEILYQLSEYAEEWEVRHGALVAMKFLAVVKHQKITSEMDIDLTKVARIGSQRLSDNSDDVKSIGCQLLSELMAISSVESVVWDAAPNLWKELRSAWDISSCIPDLFALFMAYLDRDSTRFIDLIFSVDTSPRDVLNKLLEYLDSDFGSVRLACIKAIGALMGPMCESSWHYSAEDVGATCGVAIERLFRLYLTDPGEADVELFDEVRDSSWRNTVKAVTKVFRNSVDECVEITKKLIFMFFGLQEHYAIDIPFGRKIAASHAVSHFFVSTSGLCIKVVMIALEAFWDSPWWERCEAALALLRDLLKSSTDHSIFTKLLGQINATLNAEPLCARILSEASGAQLLSDTSFNTDCKDAFVKANINSCKMRIDARSTSDSIRNLWKTAMTKYGVSGDLDSEVRLESIRIHAIASGAILSDGIPEKVTPIMRTLMTSLKNEKCALRYKRTCVYISEFLEITKQDPKYTIARSRVLEHVCDILLDEPPANNLRPNSILSTVVQSIDEFDELTKLSFWPKIEILVSGKIEHFENTHIFSSLTILNAIATGLRTEESIVAFMADSLLPSLTEMACTHVSESIRSNVNSTLGCLISRLPKRLLKSVLAKTVSIINGNGSHNSRMDGCNLIETLMSRFKTEMIPFVRDLLPLTMSLMTDRLVDCSRKANNIFASLVELSPLVDTKASEILLERNDDRRTEDVVNHLILGKPLPPYKLPDLVQNELDRSNTELRRYQQEGVTWLRFLQSVNLNGALTDSMGLGKTLQALIAIALAHQDSDECIEVPRSLIVCPSSLVGHWAAEVFKYFPGNSVFTAFRFAGSISTRKSAWNEKFESCNIVLTSYAVLRSEIGLLSKQRWRVCVLDEGHLLKNPKTVTAKASRLINAKHKILLTGTPIQNHVNELWATFDFLMPNFLGSLVDFSREFAKPIAKGYLPGASSDAINEGMSKLKTLHQRVLPFILRREKENVLQELPPKNVIILRFPLSDLQRRLYIRFCSGPEIQESLVSLEDSMNKRGDNFTDMISGETRHVLGSLLFLRLLCTHPILVAKGNVEQNISLLKNVDVSGKFLALVELLKQIGIYYDNFSGADNDSSLMYCEDDECIAPNESEMVLSENASVCPLDFGTSNDLNKLDQKCLIFAQFSQSLDAVESIIMKPLMPSVRYLRLDGKTPPERRADVAREFNEDPNIKVLLLTTRVGSLGLNLAGASNVVLLESDYNPFADLQAMDRAHRIGQNRTVNVYRLIAEESIDEKILHIQEIKTKTSNAIVNTENSTMFSMGTDKLLDIFTCQTSTEKSKPNQLNDMNFDLDALIESYVDDYEDLSVREFVRGFKPNSV